MAPAQLATAGARDTRERLPLPPVLNRLRLRVFSKPLVTLLLYRPREDSGLFDPEWDIRKDERSFQPPSIARRLIQGSLLPSESTLHRDFHKSYHEEGEFRDYVYGQLREVVVRHP